MRYKAICSDIDGTLLNKERVLSPRTISAISRLSPDIRVILASSRMPKAMRHLQHDLSILHSPLICYNGAYILAFDDQENPQELHSSPIPVDICAELAGFTARIGLHLGLYYADEWYVRESDYWSAREENNTRVQSEVADFDEVLQAWERAGKGGHKLMCMGEAADVQASEDFLRTHYGDRLHLYRSKDTYLEISDRSISKASALEKVIAHLGSFKMNEVVAFGDNYNDMDMLQAVGLGVAVENARAEVLEMANAKTLRNTEDGVAIAIEKFLLGL